MVRVCRVCVCTLYSGPGEARDVLREARHTLACQQLFCAQFQSAKVWEWAPQLLPRILCPCTSRIVLLTKSDPSDPFFPTQPASPTGGTFQFSQSVWRLPLSHPGIQHTRLCPLLSPLAGLPLFLRGETAFGISLSVLSVPRCVESFSRQLCMSSTGKWQVIRQAPPFPKLPSQTL